MQLSISIQGNLIEKLKTADKKTRAIIQSGVGDASTFLMERSIRETPASTGNLRKSIRREIFGDGLKARIFPSVKYGSALHGGFSGPQRSSPFVIPAREAAPGGSLYRWAKKKGMNPYAVRESIKKKGIQHNRYLKRASEGSESGIKSIFEKTLANIANSLGD